MLGAPDWDAIGYAGAFLLGALVATVAVLRVVRSLTQFFARSDRPRRDDE